MQVSREEGEAARRSRWTGRYPHGTPADPSQPPMRKPAGTTKKTFPAVITAVGGGSACIAVPFEPDEVWGKKNVHHVAGQIGICATRGPLTRVGGVFVLKLGPAWLRDCPFAIGAEVDVTLWPEGAQRGELAPDLAQALAKAPKAAAFFDGLAQFYRKGYLRWIDATKRRPDERTRRIAATIALLQAGEKARPR